MPNGRDANQAVELWIDDAALHLKLRDGREHSVPLDFFPTLRNAAPSARNDWRWVGGGHGIHWPTLDFDLTTEGLLEGVRENFPPPPARDNGDRSVQFLVRRTDGGWVVLQEVRHRSKTTVWPTKLQAMRAAKQLERASASAADAGAGKARRPAARRASKSHSRARR